MFHLFCEANEEHDNDRYENVRHKKHYPARIMRIKVGYSKQNIAADEISVEKYKFHQQHHKNEL